MKEILAILILCLPLIWELWNDRNGDFNKKADVLFRALLIVNAGFIVWGFFNRNLFAAMNLSFAIHWLLFDYLIHIILYRNGVITSTAWFKYMGKSSKIDNISWWRNMNPWLRLQIRLTYFLISLYLYLTI